MIGTRRTPAQPSDGEAVPIPVGAASPLVGPRRHAGILLESERLILRRYQHTDFTALRDMAADPRMFRHSERGPMTEEEAWDRLLRHAGHWDLVGYGIFLIEEKATGRFVGECGVSDFRRGLGAGFDLLPEMTWSVIPEFQARGLGGEAAEAILNWLPSQEVGAVVCLIHAGNARSLDLARRLGFRRVRCLDYRGYRAIILRRPAAKGPLRLVRP